MATKQGRSVGSPAFAEVGMVPTPATLGCSVGDNGKSAVVSLVDRTNALLRGLDLILSHHRVSKEVRAVLDCQVHAYLDSSKDESVWLKRGKYLLSYPFALYLRNEVPEVPDLDFKPAGALRKWMKCHLLNFNRKNTHLWFSWMQAKRSCLPASEEMIDLTYNKHFATLTREDDGDSKTIEEIFSDPHFIEHLDCVRAGVMSYFLKDSRGFTDRTASLSASFEHSRARDGSFGSLKEISLGRESNVHDALSSTITELRAMTYTPTLLTRDRVRCNVVMETRSEGTIEEEEDWRSGLVFSRTQLKKRILGAKIQGIVEPMKVRVISKGPALEYYACKPLQEAMHSTMRKMDAYRLIGRPLSPTDIMDLDDVAIDKGLRGDEEWASVDYSAATDGLSWKYSGRIFEYVIQDLSPAMKSLALDVLGPHELFYPRSDRRGYEKKARGIMRRGQLMGSILSFPILCLANMGLYLRVTRKYHEGWTYQERMSSVLVNGDDQLYLAPLSVFYEHIDIGKKIGLEMTVGKAYHHKSYTNVNSTCVVLPIGGSCPREIPFLNTGLYFGQQKVMAVEGSDVKSDLDSADSSSELEVAVVEAPIIPLLEETLRGSLPGRQCTLLASWLALHADRVRNETAAWTKHGKFSRNLFVPKCFGGMGILPPVGWKTQIKSIHRQLAKWMVGSILESGYATTQSPTLGSAPKSISRIMNVPYQNKSIKKDVTPYIPIKKWKQGAPKVAMKRIRQPLILYSLSTGVAIAA
jgi:hypothetical protein